jgi:hypothetical protein
VLVMLFDDASQGLIRQFVVCFQARGAPGGGQGDPGARGRPEDPKKLPKPIENLLEIHSSKPSARKVSLWPDSGH